MRKHVLRRVLANFYSTNWAILPEKMSEIREFIDLRASGVLFNEQQLAERIGTSEQSPLVEMIGGVAVMNLFGVIGQRMNMIQRSSGGISTEQVASEFARLVNDSGVTSIVMNWDSPGGSVPGVAELSGKIYEARDKKRIISISNSMMCSAACWIGTAANEVWATVDSWNSSIGVLAIHTEFCKLREKAGITDTIITAGQHKGEGNELQPLTESAKKYRQEQADEIMARFQKAVALHRGISVERVAKSFGQGRAISAQDALEVGLVDRIGTLEELIASLGGDKSSVSTRATRTSKSPARLFFKGFNAMNKNVFEALVKRGLCAVDASEDVALVALSAFFAGQGKEKPATDELVIAALTGKPTTAVAPASAPIESVSAGFIRDQISLAKQMGNLSAEVAFDLLNELTAGQFTTQQIADKINAACAKHAGPLNHGQTRVVADSRDKFFAAAVDGMLSQHWCEGTAPHGDRVFDVTSGNHRDWKPDRLNHSLTSIKSLGRELCVNAGMSPQMVARMSDIDVVQLINGMNTNQTMGFVASDLARNVTGTYANITTTALYAVLRDGYDYAERTFDKWCLRDDDFDNFQSRYIIEVGEAPLPLAVPENGEFEDAETVDAKTGYKLVNWGRKFTYSWELQLADRFGAVAKLIDQFGQGFPTRQNRLIYGDLKANVTLERDSVALFHADHDNLTTGAIGNYKTALGTMRLKMARQKGLMDEKNHTEAADQNVLGLTAKFILSGEALADELAVFLGSVADTTQANPNVKNAFLNRYTQIVDEQLGASGGGSDTALYLASDPRRLACVMYAYLRGHSSPRMVRVDNTNRLGQSVLIYQPFGRKVVDWRGLQKHSGA